MTRLLCTICLIAISLIAGCGTLVHGPNQHIMVTSNPSRAIVTTTTGKRIKTPDAFQLSRTKSTTLTARLSGYEDAEQKIESEWSPWILGNGIGSFIGGIIFNFVPGLASVVVDFSTGSTGVLSPAEVHFELMPKEK